jgi:hypothetical protein
MKTPEHLRNGVCRTSPRRYLTNICDIPRVSSNEPMKFTLGPHADCNGCASVFQSPCSPIFRYLRASGLFLPQDLIMVRVFCASIVGNDLQVATIPPAAVSNAVDVRKPSGNADATKNAILVLDLNFNPHNGHTISQSHMQLPYTTTQRQHSRFAK